MTALWLVGACLIAGALLFLLPPLLQRPAAGGRAIAPPESNLRVYRHQLDELRQDLAAGTLTADQYISQHPAPPVFSG